MASIEEEFRGGINEHLYGLLKAADKRNDVKTELYLFYEAMYLKKAGMPFEELLLAAIKCNNQFPNAYLELAELHQEETALNNFYHEKAINGMRVIGYLQSSDLFNLDYYFNEVVYQREIS
jgi:hypothetical protein